jgi:Phosphotransferase enzyme family
VTGWRDRSLADLLEAHGLTGVPEHPFPTDGWSGSSFSSLELDGERFVLKRISPGRDWIVRATRDDDLREAWVASMGRPEGRWLQSFSGAVLTPYLGAASDPDGGAVILMPDLSTELVAWERPAHEPVLDPIGADRFIDRIALLHTLPWSEVLVPIAVEGTEPAPTPPWCPLPERLTLLTRRSATGYAADGNPVGERFLAGWDAFDRFAPPAARDLLTRLGDDPAPLLAALAMLPDVGLHGDLKLANVALIDEERVAFIDWQMTLRAPIAVELGWCIVTNSAELPFTPEEVLRRYRDSLTWYAGRWGSGRRRHDVEGLAGDWALQVDLVAIIGLLLRGWRKGIDTDAGATLASGITAADDLAWWATKAVDAADRRL